MYPCKGKINERTGNQAGSPYIYKSKQLVRVSALNCFIFYIDCNDYLGSIITTYILQIIFYQFLEFFKIYPQIACFLRQRNGWSLVRFKKS